MKVYNKLVRDKIPQIIHAQGKTCNTRVLEDAEYKAMLTAKLEEEMKEFLNASEEEQLAELADIVEVIYAIVESKGKSLGEFESIRKTKEEQRGGFNDKLFLISVEDNKN